jgi:hypothetical protein
VPISGPPQTEPHREVVDCHSAQPAHCVNKKCAEQNFDSMNTRAQLHRAPRAVRSSAVGISIACMPVVFYVSGEAGLHLQASYIAFLLSVLSFALRRPMAVGAMAKHLWMPLWLLIMGAFSILANADTYAGAGIFTAGVALINSVALLVAGLLISKVMSKHELEIAMSWVSYVVAVFLLWALLFHWTDRLGDRFSGNGIHPNWWGSVAYGAAASAALSGSRRVLYVVAPIALGLCLEASSRGSIVAIAVMLIALSPSALSHHKKGLMLLSASGMVALTALLISDFDLVTSFLLNDVFEVNNQYRGFGTGFVGREEGWAQGWAAIAQSPLFGSGYTTLPELHNGFLLMAGEIGVVGGLIFAGVCAYAAIRARGDRAIAAVVWSYLVFMMFAPRAVNLVLGSMIPVIAIMMAISLPRVERRRGGSGDLISYPSRAPRTGA